MRRGAIQDTLFHQLEVLETAICQGQSIELVQSLNLYGNQNYSTLQMYPLQLLYHDVAWYLLGERLADRHLVIYRMNRLKNYCKILKSDARGSNSQRQSLELAHRLLKNGWGLFLGNPSEQKDELAGQLLFETVKVKFYPPVSHFILEGNYRHPHQKVSVGPLDADTDEPHYVIYQIKLPPRSLQEFSYWLSRYMEHVEILSPTTLAQRHYLAGKALVERYDRRD